MRRLVLLLMLLLIAFAAAAQNNPYGHDSGHDAYIRWKSGNTGNCCNNMDCRPLAPSEWTEDRDGYSVRVAQEWCRVEQKHFLITGRSPDITVAHACISHSITETCKRLLCFDPPAKF